MDNKYFVGFSDTADISFIMKFLKFGLVGISGMIVDFGVTSFLKEVLKVRKYISNSIGFTLAATSNFILNRIWTFNNTNPAVIMQFSKFFIISLIGLLLNKIPHCLFLS